jgi:hypothetical protein
VIHNPASQTFFKRSSLYKSMPVNRFPPPAVLHKSCLRIRLRRRASHWQPAIRHRSGMVLPVSRIRIHGLSRNSKARVHILSLVVDLRSQQQLVVGVPFAEVRCQELHMSPQLLRKIVHLRATTVSTSSSSASCSLAPSACMQQVIGRRLAFASIYPSSTNSNMS